MPLISICIPAYKRIEFLKRLLDSIALQTFKDFEVIVTDDSPDENVKYLCDSYQGKYNISYFKNNQQLGTPENWNEAIRKANGEWIKLMHDDDWFHDANSLQSFAGAIKNNPGYSFFFSAYRNVYLDDKKEEDVFLNKFRYKLLLKNVSTLFSQNIIGPPSVTVHKNDVDIFYDKNLKWLVDIDFYMRYFGKCKPFYIDKVLVNVGLSSQQVTKEVFRVKKIEVPENFYLLDKIGVWQLKNIYVYDAWWRFMRNLKIRTIDDVRSGGYLNPLPAVLEKMIHFQNKIPSKVLNIGPFSKFFMLISFIKLFKKIGAP
ncbi:MAG TPA: glycosyltransferase family 2 protein [Puia sp.]|nr:glycosyltransferase family 2 protein [Puia sp.]